MALCNQSSGQLLLHLGRGRNLYKGRWGDAPPQLLKDFSLWLPCLVPSSLVTPNLQCRMSSPFNPSLLQNHCPSNIVTHTATCTGCILIKFLMPPELAPLPPDSQTLEPSVISPGLALSHPHHGRNLSVPMCFHFPGLTSPQPGHLSPLAIHAMYTSEFSIQLRKTPFKFSVAPRSELCLCSSSPIPPSVTFTEGLLP